MHKTMQTARYLYGLINSRKDTRLQFAGARKRAFVLRPLRMRVLKEKKHLSQLLPSTGDKLR